MSNSLCMLLKVHGVILDNTRTPVDLVYSAVDMVLGFKSESLFSFQNMGYKGRRSKIILGGSERILDVRNADTILVPDLLIDFANCKYKAAQRIPVVS